MRDKWELYTEVRDRTLAGQPLRQIASEMRTTTATVRMMQRDIPRPLPVMTVDEFNYVLFHGAAPMPAIRDAA